MTTNKVKKTLSVMGVAAASFAAVLSTTGCSTNKIQKAQDKLGETVVEKLNEKAVSKDDFFSKFTFLCANVLKDENAGNFNIDINGTGKYQNIDKETFTTLSYKVDDNYFDGKQLGDSADVIDSFTEIVATEQMQSLSSVNVSSTKTLNDTMKKVTLSEAKKTLDQDPYVKDDSLYNKLESKLEDKMGGNLKISKNLLYNVSDIKIDAKKGVATFSTKELSEFKQNGMSFNIIAANHIMRNTSLYGSMPNIYANGINPYLYGLPVQPTQEDSGTFFINNGFSVQLTPEEIELAKQDKSVVLDKFCEYVKKGEKDKYEITYTVMSDLAQNKVASSSNNNFSTDKTFGG